MKILVAGAAGNLGSRFASHLLGAGHDIRLLVHRTPPPKELTSHARAEVCPGDLASSQGLDDVCRGCDAIVYSAGRLFAPRPEGFLPVTNVEYVRNLAVAARAAGVRRFVLMSFPHVEGETTPDRPARGLRDGTPSSVHARTRLEAEHCLFDACAGSEMTPVVLRVGAVYGPGILMLEAARKLMRWRLMAVWRRPTWLHLIALPDLLSGIQAAVEKQGVEGIYPLCDDRPITLQDFLDRMARELGYSRPRRLPAWCFLAAGAATELYATVTGGIAPLTRDFIRIGMSSSVADTSRRTELVPRLAYPTLEDGISLLHPASASQSAASGMIEGADMRVGEMQARNCFVGYVDLLGFSALIRSDFDRAQADYIQILLDLDLIDEAGKLRIFPKHVEITAASDSFLIVGDQLQHVANWCSSIQVAAIRTGRLARGGIAYGRHIQRNVHSEGGSRHHLLVVSEALVSAVDEERKESRPPCGVTLHPSISTQAIEALDGKQQLAKQRSIVFKDGCWIANPFGADVLHWVEPKLREMRDDPSNAKHVEKYEWLLEFFHAVKANSALRP